MSASAEILQEYLVKIGFQTNSAAMKKIENNLGGVSKKVFGVGAAVASMVAAVGAAEIAFAYSMRKMYFSSELANSSVKNMEAMEFAGNQMGISGDTMAAAVHNMAQAVRLNPGLQAFVESLGIKVTGRDTSDVMMDTVKAFSKMPEYVGVQYAEMFGLDPDTYHQMINHLHEIGAAKKEALSMYSDLGFDPDKHKKELLEFTHTMDDLERRFSLLGQSFLVAVLPAFKEFAQFANDEIKELIALLGGKESGTEFLSSQTKKFGGSGVSSKVEKFANISKAGVSTENLIDTALVTTVQQLVGTNNLSPSNLTPEENKESRIWHLIHDLTGGSTDAREVGKTTNSIINGKNIGEATPGPNTAAALGSNTNNVSMTQHNEFHVYESTNANKTADSIATRVNKGGAGMFGTASRMHGTGLNTP